MTRKDIVTAHILHRGPPPDIRVEQWEVGVNVSISAYIKIRASKELFVIDIVQNSKHGRFCVPRNVWDSQKSLIFGENQKRMKFIAPKTIVCQECSARIEPLVEYFFYHDQRVCKKCYDQLLTSIPVDLRGTPLSRAVDSAVVIASEDKLTICDACSSIADPAKKWRGYILCEQCLEKIDEARDAERRERRKASDAVPEVRFIWGKLPEAGKCECCKEWSFKLEKYDKGWMCPSCRQKERDNEETQLESVFKSRVACLIIEMRKWKIVVGAGLLVIAIMLLFPPFESVYPYYKNVHVDRGYAFVGSPPSADTDARPYPHRPNTVQIATTRLWTTVGGIALLTAVGAGIAWIIEKRE